MAYTIDEDGSKTESIGDRKKNRVANYTIEDKINVQNFNKSGRSTPKPFELESLRRQYGKKV